jgi:hypothetical protein
MMLMIGIVVAVRVGVPGAIRMHMLMFMEQDLQPAFKRIGDAAQGGEARHVIAALQARDHGFSHRQPLRELLLRLAGAGSKREQVMGALRGDGGAVVERPLPAAAGGLCHARNLAKLRSLEQARGLPRAQWRHLGQNQLGMLGEFMIGIFAAARLISFIVYRAKKLDDVQIAEIKEAGDSA